MHTKVNCKKHGITWGHPIGEKEEFKSVCGSCVKEYEDEQLKEAISEYCAEKEIEKSTETIFDCFMRESGPGCILMAPSMYYDLFDKYPSLEMRNLPEDFETCETLGEWDDQADI